MLKKYFDLDVRIIFAVIILIELVFNYILSNFIFTEELLYNTFAEQLTLEQLEKGINIINAYDWVGYAIIPFSILLQIFLITLCLNIGALLLRYQISFRTLFSTVIKAFGIYAISKIVLLVMYSIYDIQSAKDFQYLPQFSLYDLVNNENLSPWLIYPLQLINLFDLFFILLLAFGLNLIQERGMKRWVPFVLSTYGTGLVIWAILMVFLFYLG